MDFRRMMDERKVLLVRLSLGSIGEENAYLLGSLLVSKLHQATLSRQNIAEENRQPFFLYLDEAHHFVTESMNQILSGVRKYKLGLVLAHQQLRQFQTGESDILSSVLANYYTRICFRLDDADAERLAKGFSFFTAEHLKNLGVDAESGEILQTCTIITTDANEILSPVHNRMPVILKAEDYELWLDGKVKDREQLENLLKPYSAKEMSSHAVGRQVNNPGFDSEELIAELNSK